MLLTTGASLLAVTVKVAASAADAPSGSVAVKVMVLEPFQPTPGFVIVVLIPKLY
jgi:hypothetical protein